MMASASSREQGSRRNLVSESEVSELESDSQSESEGEVLRETLVHEEDVNTCRP